MFFPLLLALLHLIPSSPPVEVGLSRLLGPEGDFFKGKRVGIFTNQTGILPDGRHIVDLLVQDGRFQVVALFATEHGIRGELPAGATFSSSTDSLTGLPLYSLYGSRQKPDPEMLKGLDVLLFDIQDVGTRFYAYLNAMLMTLEAAAEVGVEFVVLDRPNPITGDRVEGPILDPKFQSFVGQAPLPLRHGLTAGELARMAVGEGWIAGAEKARLRVLPLSGWRRAMWFDETGLPWVKPSPNMLTLATAILYPGTALLEGTNVSEGRGTLHPFEYLGAPWVEGERLARALNRLKFPGVHFEPVTFTPISLPGAAPHPKYEGQACGGVFARVLDRDRYQAVRTGLEILAAVKALYPQHFAWRRDHYVDLLAGTDGVRRGIDQGKGLEEILGKWRNAVDEFKKKREAYLIYQ